MRFKKVLFFLFIFSAAASFKGQNKTRTSENTGNNLVEVGYIDAYEKLPKLKFEKISQAEFERYKPQQFWVMPRIEQNKNEFFLRTRSRKHRFKKYDSDTSDKNGNTFSGYYSKLHLFAVVRQNVSEHLNFSELFLIDKDTDYKYQIISIGDERVEMPIPSTNAKYLVYFHNYAYQHKHSFIGVLKINQKSDPKNYLQEYASFQSDYFAVENIVWIDDNSLVIRGFEEKLENEKWMKTFSYYKSIFQ